jgi:hypothetical protein
MQGRQTLKWPESLKKTAIRQAWFNKIATLPAGLDLAEAVDRLNESYGAVRRWAVLFGYQFPDRRRTVSSEQWSSIDWNLRDADIARELGVTRECVRLVRRAKGVGPSAAQASIRKLGDFIGSNRDRLHGLLVEDVIRHCGTDLPYHVVRRVLRDQGVKPHEVHSPLRDINWRLPNRELAVIWGTSPRYIANLRARLKVGPSKWTARHRTKARGTEFAATLARERQRAQGHRKKERRSPASFRQAVMS